jgi:hypothetical protein
MNVVGTVKRLAEAFVGERANSLKPAELASQQMLERTRPLLSEIKALLAERSRLVGLRDEEQGKRGSLGRRLSELEAARLDALTEHRISADEAASTKAAELLAQVAAVRQEMNDAVTLAARLDERAKEVDLKLDPLKRNYQQTLGVYLGEIYRQLVEHYDEHAREAGEAVVQIAALHRVMIRYLAGNTNGWNGALLLPKIDPGNGRTLEPLFDAGSRKFAEAATEHMDAILGEMRAAGFIWRFD